MRTWIWVVVVALALAVVVVALANAADFLQHWLAVHTGVKNGGPDPYYNFWSGVGSDLGEVTLITAILTPVVIAARHHNCATRGCWRLTSHTIEDPDSHVKYRRCHKHHPCIPDEHSRHGIFRNHMSDEHLAEVDAAHIASTTHREGAP